jgi:hypothetical protein
MAATETGFAPAERADAEELRQTTDLILPAG